MNQVFVELSELQSYVESTTEISKDALCVSVLDDPDFPVIMAIQKDKKDLAHFLLSKESTQKLFDWLKKKNIVQK